MSAITVPPSLTVRVLVVIVPLTAGVVPAAGVLTLVSVPATSMAPLAASEPNVPLLVRAASLSMARESVDAAKSIVPLLTEAPEVSLSAPT